MRHRLTAFLLVVAMACSGALIAPTPASASAPTVSLHIAPRNLVLGQSFHAYGHASSARAAHQRVWLQQHTSKGWKNIEAGTFDAHSNYSLNERPRNHGAYAYRVVWLYFASGPVTVYTRRWTWLSDSYPVQDDSECSFNEGQYTINGVRYLHSVQEPFYLCGSGWAEWNLSRTCSTFDSVVGLDDSSPSDAQTNFDVSADGVDLYNTTLSLGQSPRVTEKIGGYLRIRLTATVIQMTSGATGPADFGDARVLCL